MLPWGHIKLLYEAQFSSVLAAKGYTVRNLESRG